MSTTKKPRVDGLPTDPRDPRFWEASGGVVFPVPDGIVKEDFIRRFPNFLYCLINELEKSPVDHLFEANNAILRSYQEQGYGVYFSVNGFKRLRDATGDLLPPNRTTENLEFVNGHYVDIDCPKDWRDPAKTPAIDFHTKLRKFKQEAFASLVNLDHPARQILPYIPNLIIETRHGLQAVWLFDEPIELDGATEEKKQAFYASYTENQREIISLFGGDRQASDLVRVIRFPFTWHLKNPQNPFPCVPILWNLGNDGIVKAPTFKDFCVALSKTPAIVAPESSEALRTEMRRANTAFGKLSESEHEEIVSEIERLYPKRERPSIQKLASSAPNGERNNTLHIVACAYRQSGMGEEEALTALEGYSGLSRAESRAVVKSAYKRPKEYGWNHPTIASMLTDEERSTYRAFYAEVAHAKFGKKHKNLDKLVTAPEVVDPVAAKKEAEQSEVTQSVEKDAKIRADVLVRTRKEALAAYHHRMAALHPTIRYLGSLGAHRREGNIYRPITDKEELRHLTTRAMEADGFLDLVTKSAVDNTILKWTGLEKINIPDSKIEPVPEAGLDFLPVQNGVLDLASFRLKPYPDDEAWLSTSPASYDPDATCPRFEQFMKEITGNDEKKIAILQEIAGYVLSSSTRFQKAFVLIGSGSNGKSVFVGILEKLLGDSLSVSLGLDDLDERFAGIELERKRMNVIDEVSDNYFSSATFKKLVGGSPITADVKFERHRKFRMTAKFVFTVNTLPRIDANDHALYRRLLIVKFDQTFKGEQIDMNLSEKLETELSGILNWCLKGYSRVMQNNAFTEHNETAESLEEMNETNSLLVRFLLSSKCSLGNEINGPSFMENVDKLYEAYSAYTYAMGGRPKQITTFQQELSNLTHQSLSHIICGRRNPKTGIILVSGVSLRVLSP
jgi:P4 family phage/plasmid primase-like protien